MFQFDQGDSTKRTKQKWERRFNDENAMVKTQKHQASGSASGGSAQLTSSLQPQVASKPALGASAAPTPTSAVLPATPRRGVRAGNSIQIVENFELKRRLQELESIARGAEKENSRLQRLVKQSQESAERANARCIAESVRANADNARAAAESARANAEKERADAARAEVQRASAQFMTESARASAERKRAEEVIVEARRAAALAEVESARARAEKERADRATEVAAVARNEAALAHEAVEAASARALVRINEAMTTTAQEKSKAEEVAAKMSLLCSNIEALATLALGKAHIDEKPVKLNGKAAAATRANSRDEVGVQPVSAQLLDIYGTEDNDKGNVMRSTFLNGFCELVATATGRELPQEALHRLLILTPSPREGVRHDCDPGTSSNLASSKEERNIPVASETPMVASHASISAIAATRSVDRSTTIRRVQLNARLAKREKEARRIEEERLREKVERCEGRQKRKEEAMHGKPCISVEVDTGYSDGAGNIPRGEGEHLENGQHNRQEKEVGAHQSRGKRSKRGGSTSAASPGRRQQKQARKLRGKVSGSKDNRDLATDQVAASTPADAIGEATTKSKSTYTKTEEAMKDRKMVDTKTVTAAEHDEAVVEEVPMPTEDMAGEFLCSDDWYGVQGGFNHPAVGKTGDEIPVDEEGKSSKTESSIKSSRGVAEGDEVTAKSTAGEGGLKVMDDKKTFMVIRRCTRSMSPARGMLTEEKDGRQVDRPASTIAEPSFAGRCSPKKTPKKFTASPRTAFIGPIASRAISTSKPSFKTASVATGLASRRGPLRQDVVSGSKLSIRGKRFRLGMPTPPVTCATHGSASGESIDCEIKSVDGDVTCRRGAGARGSRGAFNDVPSTAGDKKAIEGALEEQTLSSLLPFGDDVVKTVDAERITGVAKAWLEGAAMEGSEGVLTSVLAVGQVFMEKHAMETARCEPRILMQTEVVQCLQTLVIAIAKAESCARRHEARARLEAVGSMESAPSLESEKKGGGNKRAKVALAAARVKKRVKFCAFDLSAVDMPCEGFQGSELAAKEMADCLARVVDTSMLLQRALQKATPKRGKGSARQGDGFAMWKAFLRGVHTVAVAPPVASSRVLEVVKMVCSGLGVDVSLDTVSRAAFLLLDELLPLERKEPPVKSPLRMRLAGFLSALIRFNLRVMFNPPPPKSSIPSVYSSYSVGADRSNVHQVIRLATEEPKRSRKDGYNPTRQGATSAVLSRALRRLYGYSDEGALRVIAAAEAFVVEVKGNSSVSADEIAPLARQHSLDTVDIVAAIRARGFVMELLEHPGVEEAIAEARGWGEVERLSATLQKVKDCPDADAALSLLAGVQGLKSWLGTESPWCHGERAKAVLTKLDTILVACDKKEAKRFSQEARRRMWFPRVVAATPSMEAGTE